MNKKFFLKSVVATSLLGLSGIAAAVCTTCTNNSNPVYANQPNSNPGAFSQTFSQTGLRTGGGISGLAGSFASGAGGSGPRAGAESFEVKRYALTSEKGVAGAAASSQWNVWVATAYNKVAYGFAPLSSQGHVSTFVGGVDYTFDNNIVGGVAISYDNTSIGVNSGGNVTGTGYTVAPYIGIPITSNLAFDATIGYGRTNIDTNLQAVVGSTSDDRTVGALGLTYRENYDDWSFTGRASVLSVHDKLGSYTLSNGTFLAAGTVNVTQARVTGSAAYNMGQFSPYVGLSLVYDISAPDQAPVNGVAAANDRSAYVPTVGIRFKTDSAVYGNVQYSTEQGRSEVKNNQLLFNIGIRF